MNAPAVSPQTDGVVTHHPPLLMTNLITTPITTNDSADRRDSHQPSAPSFTAHHVRRLARLFHKRAGEGLCTKPFDRFAQPLRDRILSAASLVAHETPILACIFSEQAWTLLTTKRVVWQKHTHRTALPLDVISHTTVHHGKSARQRSAPPVPITRMTIVTHDGQAHAVDLEAGPACFGFQYIVKRAAKRSGQRLSEGNVPLLSSSQNNPS